MIFTNSIPDCDTTNNNPDDVYNVDYDINDNYGDSDNFDFGNNNDTSNDNMIIQIYRFKTNEIMRSFSIH